MMYLGNQAVGINTNTNINPFSKITSLASNWEYTIFDSNEDIIVDCSDIYYIDYQGNKLASSLARAFYNARNLRSITLKNYYGYPSGPVMTNFATKDGYYGVYEDNLSLISFEEKVIAPGGFVDAFSGRKNLITIDAIFDLSRIPAYSGGYNFRNAFNGCTSLKEIRFVPNSILWMNYQLFNVSQNLSDESLISIANGLDSAATQYNSITFLSTPKERCSTLMGKNENGLFVADENGTLSLYNFITTIKGWTIN